jgi:hypothetical protein
MTHNYEPTQVDARIYRRARLVQMDNPLGGTRTVSFYEEDVTQVNGDVIKQDAGVLRIEVPDAAMMTDVPLLDPATDALTGQTMTYLQIYQAVYSLYFMLAAQRDAAEVL